MIEIEPNDAIIEKGIQELIKETGGDPESFAGQLVSQIIDTSLKLMTEGHDIGQLKVITRSIKEMRYAYRIFNKYKLGPCVSIFGSARTPEDHPDYLSAKEFSTMMAMNGWMCITGAANGIMKAATEGPKKSQSFGLSIRLPFESPSNTVIEGDPKLIIFRYFFTRKLMFMSHSEALTAFPGGFGTLDELFEVLTLMQTGKANIIPIVLLEGKGGNYWQNWQAYMHDNLIKKRFISQEDERFYYMAPSVEAGVAHILKFYSRYHSSRYVKDTLVIRLLRPLTPEEIRFFNDQYKDLLASGTFYSTGPLSEETDALELPRLAFHHNRRNFGRLRILIDDINSV